MYSQRFRTKLSTTNVTNQRKRTIHIILCKKFNIIELIFLMKNQKFQINIEQIYQNFYIQMITSSPHHGIFKNVPLRPERQAVPYYPYKTQNFRMKQYRKIANNSVKKVDEQLNKQLQNQKRQQTFISFNKQTIGSPPVSQKSQNIFHIPGLIKGNANHQNKGNFLLKTYKRQYKKVPIKNFINQQHEQQTSQSRQKQSSFRKTFCSSFTARNNKNQSLELKLTQRRPPTSQIQGYKPISTRIRKISNIGEQSNNNFLAKYEIIKQLGKGTYGTVYLAKIIDDKRKTIINVNENIFNKTMTTSWIGKQNFNQIQEGKIENKSDVKPMSINFDLQNKQKLAKYARKYVRQQENDQQNKGPNVNQSQAKMLQNNQTKIDMVENSETIFQQQKQPDHNNETDSDDQKQHKEKNENQNEKQQTKSPKLHQEYDIKDLVAIKVYQKFKMNKDPSKFKNIRKQITIMQNLSHTGVIKLYQSVQSITKISLVVQYGGQYSLLDYLKKYFPLTKQKIKNFSKQLLNIVIYLHQKNIVHRDIKPQNILIKQHKVNGQKIQQLKLIDYGFSTLTNKSRKLNAICGTPNFMAPQLLSSKQYFGQKADVWSYGVVVFVMAQGRHPFKSSQYQQLQRLVNKGKFSFKRKHEQSFQSFIYQILKVNSYQRPTAQQISKFKWINQQ